MTNQFIKPAIDFTFDGKQIRTVMSDGEAWFVAADVCKALNLSNPSKAVAALDDDEKALTSIQGLSRGNDIGNIINESGLYTLVLRCRDAVKPGTLPYRFRKWVTSEVLPQIRKTGAYQQHSPSVNTPVVKQDNEYRYLVQVFIYDTIFGSCVEMKGKGNTFKSIANGIATDLGYRPTGFVEGKVNRVNVSRM